MTDAYFVNDWSRYKNFTEEEFKCSHSNQAHMLIEFMDKLQAVRTKYGKRMVITSGYRSPEHEIEAAKEKRGEHTYGAAVDIQCSPSEAKEILSIVNDKDDELCYFPRIGLKQTGPYAGRFIHLGIGFQGLFPLNVMWTY